MASADQVAKIINSIVDSFDLTSPGENGSLADDLLDIYALGVIDRTIAGKDADGHDLAPNQGEYGEEKDKAGKPVGIGLDADSIDRMLSEVQVKGERTITPDEVRSVYGVTKSAKDKANWFTYGSSGSSTYWEYSGAAGQPERHFWGFDEEIIDAIMERCKKRVEAAVQAAGG